MYLDIQANDAQNGATSYCLWAWCSPAMTLCNVRILVGRGGYSGGARPHGQSGLSLSHYECQL